MPKKIRHACRFLEGNEKIAAFLGAIERNARLLEKVRSVLPPPLKGHCLLAVLDAGVLTLTTDSPVWSSRLRFFAPQLERHLSPTCGSVKECRVRIRPQVVAPIERTKPKQGLSKKVQNHLEDAAAGIDDAELAAALRRLARAGATGSK